MRGKDDDKCLTNKLVPIRSSYEGPALISRVFHLCGHTKVGQLHIAAIGQQDVGRFDIPVNNSLKEIRVRFDHGPQVSDLFVQKN